MPNDSDRLTELETKFTFLEDTLDALNEVLLEHGRQLEELERRNAALERRIVHLSSNPEAPGDGPADPPLT